jgi:hypothetical protein
MSTPSTTIIAAEVVATADGVPGIVGSRVSSSRSASRSICRRNRRYMHGNAACRRGPTRVRARYRAAALRRLRHCQHEHGA